MKSTELMLRCYAERKNGIWQAFCLDFTLAVQGDSVEEVKNKLESQILEYVHDALVGKDKKHAKDLLERKAPLKYWLKFYFFIALYHVQKAQQDFVRLLELPIPLAPQQRC